MTDGEKVEYTVFVRNINFATTSETLSHAFAKYGPVKNIRIITRYNGTDRVSRGFGFVEFASADGFNAATSAAAPLVVDDRELFVRPSRPIQKRDTAFVRGIPEGTTEDDIRSVFAKYNPVTVRIKFFDNADSNGFGFVTFDTEEHQTAAVLENKTIQLKGKESIVRFARPPRTGGFRRRRIGGGGGGARVQRAARAPPEARRADAAPPADAPRRRGPPRRDRAPGDSDRFVYRPAA